MKTPELPRHWHLELPLVSTGLKGVGCWTCAIKRCDGRRVRGYAEEPTYSMIAWHLPWQSADFVGCPEEAIDVLELLASKMNITLLCECTPEQVLKHDIEQAVRETGKTGK